MKVFVSGKTGREQETRALMTALEQNGHVVTFDWTTLPHLRPYADHTAEAREAAIQELQGVLAAEVLVVLADERGVGMYVELGAALALGKPVVAISEGESRTMFMHHPLVRCVRTLDDVLPAVATIAGRSSIDG